MTRKGTKRIAVWLKPKRVGHSSTGQARRTGEADRARAKGSDCDFARVPARWGRVGSEGFRDSRRRLPAVTHASAPRRRAHTRNFPAWVGEGSRRPWGSDPRTSRHFRNLRWRIGFPGSGVGWGCWTSWDENHPARLSTINIPFRRLTASVGRFLSIGGRLLRSFSLSSLYGRRHVGPAAQRLPFPPFTSHSDCGRLARSGRDAIRVSRRSSRRVGSPARIFGGPTRHWRIRRRAGPGLRPTFSDWFASGRRILLPTGSRRQSIYGVIVGRRRRQWRQRR